VRGSEGEYVFQNESTVFLIEQVNIAWHAAGNTGCIHKYCQCLIVTGPARAAVGHCTSEESLAHAIRQCFSDPVYIGSWDLGAQGAEHIGERHTHRFVCV